MAGELGRILRTKREDIASMRARTLPSPPQLRPCELKRHAGQPLRILAEFKLKSPSAGNLSTHLSLTERVASYERAGASLVSVLCDSTYFGGSYEHLTMAKEACRLPVLCKEFVLDEVQLDWARAFGADAVLIIARCVTRDDFERLFNAAQERELVPLVEIATLEEATWVNELQCPVVGVNSRDLDTLRMDAERASAVLDSLTKKRTRIHFSGIKTQSDVIRVSKSGVDAALIGEVLMRQHDPEPLLRSLVEAAASS